MAGSEPLLETVRHVDLSRCAGRWFEIARYPNRFERKCDRDVTAECSITEDSKIRVVNACITRAGKIERSDGEGSRRIDKRKIKGNFLLALLRQALDHWSGRRIRICSRWRAAAPLVLDS